MSDKNAAAKINRRVLLEQAQSSVWEETMLPQHDTFEDYVYAVINFSYVACFSAVCVFDLASKLG